jgi:hypothetical protein
MTLADFLAWPDGSGLVGTAVLGATAYVHTHVRLGRQQAARLAQAERHHEELKQHIADGPGSVQVHVAGSAASDPLALGREVQRQLLELRRRGGGRL